MKDDKHKVKTKWAYRFLNLAEQIATWSKDPSTKVGCVITKNNRIIGTGYNGFPVNVEDSETILLNKERKRLRTVHAEMNAIHFSTKSLRNSTVFCTHHPCSACMANILQHKPHSVYIWQEPSFGLSKDWELSVKEADDMALEAGVSIYKLSRGLSC